MSKGNSPAGRGDSRNLIFAFIFVAISAAMGYHAYSTMKIGTAAEMGPGFFPLMLSIVLAILAIGVGFTSIPEDSPPLRLAGLRPAILVIGSPLIFAATIRTLGLVIAIAVTTFVVSFASRHATVKHSLALTAGFTVFCVAIFSYLLNMPIPLWGTLLVN